MWILVYLESRLLPLLVPPLDLPDPPEALAEATPSPPESSLDHPQDPKEANSLARHRAGASRRGAAGKPLLHPTEKERTRAIPGREQEGTMCQQPQPPGTAGAGRAT